MRKKQNRGIFNSHDKTQRDVAQLGSALRSGRRGRRFKSCHPDQKMKKKKKNGVKKTPELLGVFIFIGKALNHVFG